MDDLISRRDAIDILCKICDQPKHPEWVYTDEFCRALRSLPSAQPEVRPIEYHDCSDVMLKMWMDNVVTDGEYNRIMDKLNAHWEEEGCKI